LAPSGAVTGVRNGGDRPRAAAGLTAWRQRPAPLRGSARGQRATLPPARSECPLPPRPRRAPAAHSPFPGGPRALPALRQEAADAIDELFGA